MHPARPPIFVLFSDLFCVEAARSTPPVVATLAATVQERSSVKRIVSALATIWRLAIGISPINGALAFILHCKSTNGGMADHAFIAQSASAPAG
jgi:hypothetical protein